MRQQTDGRLMPGRELDWRWNSAALGWAGAATLAVRSEAPAVKDSQKTLCSQATTLKQY